MEDHSVGRDGPQRNVVLDKKIKKKWKKKKKKKKKEKEGEEEEEAMRYMLEDEMFSPVFIYLFSGTNG